LSNEQTKSIVNIPDSCPHCGKELSPWQKVLLGVDRALMCKNCWYRIVLEVFHDKEDKTKAKFNSNDKENSN